MVKGLDRFRTHFAGLEDRYVLIGGAAVYVAMDDAGLGFRVTKDLDIVLFVEALDAEFGRAFWGFIEAGGYEHRQASTGEPRFYRFHDPSDTSFPAMLELFSRQPDGIQIPEGGHLTPLPIAQEIASLSAILLDDDYYGFVRSGVREADGLAVLEPTHVIPLKARAWLDLTARREAGEQVKGTDIKKHRNDVIRLHQLLGPDERVEIPPSIAEDLARFIDGALADGADPSAFGIRGVTLADVVDDLRRIYGVGA